MSLGSRCNSTPWLGTSFTLILLNFPRSLPSIQHVELLFFEVFFFKLHFPNQLFGEKFHELLGDFCVKRLKHHGTCVKETIRTPQIRQIRGARHNLSPQTKFPLIKIFGFGFWPFHEFQIRCLSPDWPYDAVSEVVLNSVSSSGSNCAEFVLPLAQRLHIFLFECFLTELEKGIFLLKNVVHIFTSGCSYLLKSSTSL